MFRKLMIASGLAFAVLAAGCASTASEKPAAAAAKPAAPAAPSAPAAPAMPAMPAAVAAAQAPGEAIFTKNCVGCHGSGRNGAPGADVLATKSASFVVEALTTGKMARMGAGLSAEEKANVAMFLTKKPVA